MKDDNQTSSDAIVKFHNISHEEALKIARYGIEKPLLDRIQTLRTALLKIQTRVENDRQLHQSDLEAIREYSTVALNEDAKVGGE